VRTRDERADHPGPSGSVKAKVEPWPSSLFAQMVPP